MNKMREEFEDWWISKNPNHTDVKSFWHETGYWVNPNSAYSNLDFAWDCWKASRAALCVELPEREVAGKYADDFEDGHESGFNDALSDCKFALKKSGVSYK